MLGQKVDTWLNLLSGFTLFSILFIPDITITASLPAIQVLDVILPVLVLGIITKKDQIIWQNYYLFLLITTAYILLTMGINSRFGMLRDYFEIYKIYKFLIVILFFTIIDIRKFINTWIKPFFVGICLINLVHFFDLFYFNEWIKIAFEGGLNIDYFGKNTLGQPAGKRMIGFMNNPNNNAVLFSFFAILFFPFRLEKAKWIWFSTALLMTFLCQSRTSLAAISGMLLCILFLKLVKWSPKQWIFFIASIVGCYLFAWMLSSQFFKYPIYGNSMFNGVALKSQSALGRLEVWKYLWDMIIEKPIFGFGPNKDFFYYNNLYSENEYILFAWRYGMIGVLMYFLFYFIPFRKLVIQHQTPYSKYIILITILLLTTAMTNNPLCERNILILFAISLGTIYNLTFNKGTEIEKNKHEINA